MLAERAKAMLKEAKTTEGSEVGQEDIKKSSFKLIRASSVTKDIFENEWLIEDHIPEMGIGEMFGDPASGKTFTVASMCFSIACGIPWYGKDVKQGSVTYIVGEGGRGIRKRFRALELEHGVEDYPLYLSDKPMDLSNLESCQDVAASIFETMGETSLMVIDTLHRNSAGGEDSSDDFGNILHNIDTAFRDIAGVVLWVHHSGHGDKSRSRGSSAKFGAVDFSHLIERGEEDTNRVTVTNNKQKEADEAPPVYLNMVVKDLGVVDKKLRPITSLVLREAKEVQVKTAKTMEDI